ncbi:MAG: 1,4-alpha-glucan branching protein GlgB [Chlamydiales bacterium]|nr:1,4-alpha-glucan branching protein GlgB [Chlamydiales bacterium]
MSETLGSDVDLQRFDTGVHYELYKFLGAQVQDNGVHFAVWAPNAKQVYVSGDFNSWQERTHPMEGGVVWKLFVPNVKIGTHYKYVIETKEGNILWKADPFAFQAQLRPETASIVADVSDFTWSPWEFCSEGPVSIYEVHLGSWKKGLGYIELAKELGAYCQKLGFTHVELLPITEHPLDESWGYQVSGFFAPTARFGTPKDFQQFVDLMHQQGIGVLLDWVPGHFPSDCFALAQFDGTYLYEYHDERLGFHPEWNTHVFDYASARVRNFLIASALFWLDVYHVDGLRIDAVQSIIMRDYARKDDQWIPNHMGGRENLEAIGFLRQLNQVIKKRFPGRLMCAEDSSIFYGVTHPEHTGGLAFDLKWSIGWMHETFDFFGTDFAHRDLKKLTHFFDYAFNERFILPLSHDEVVHEKKSLLAKMPGDEAQKFAGLRLLYAWQFFCPGRKLLFMGAEMGQKTEWSSNEELPWGQVNKGVMQLITDLNCFYRHRLYKTDFDASLCWEEKDYLKIKRGNLVGLFNFTLNTYDVQVKNQILNTDHSAYGGMGRDQLPPLTAVIYEQRSLS